MIERYLHDLIPHVLFQITYCLNVITITVYHPAVHLRVGTRSIGALPSIYHHIAWWDLSHVVNDLLADFFRQHFRIQALPLIKHHTSPVYGKVDHIRHRSKYLFQTHELSSAAHGKYDPFFL